MIHLVLFCLSLLAGAAAYPNNGNDNAYYASQWKNGQYPPPRTSNDQAQSACEPGKTGTIGFSCTHMSMLSDDMILAARKDGLDSSFIYAVAGGRFGQCGQCYQVDVQQGARKQLIVQIFNYGDDVRQGQFDIFIAAGGMGAHSAVNRDCKTNFCGKQCTEGLFKGDYAAWNYNENLNGQRNDCYKGGMRLNNSTDNAKLGKYCDALSGYDGSQLKNRILSDSCWRTHKGYWRTDFANSRSTRVACPAGLVAVTGLRLTDNSNYPRPSPSNPLNNRCTTATPGGRPCITTTHDACVPGCSWPGNVLGADPKYRVIDRCDRNGNVLIKRTSRKRKTAETSATTSSHNVEI